MAKKLGFKDFITVDYAPGMPDLIKKNAKKRKSDSGAGSNAEYASTHPPRTDEEVSVDEALTMTQRRQRARIMKRLAPRIKMGRERAKRRIASPEKIEKRARKQARAKIFARLVKDTPKSELTYARRQEIEKRLDKPAIKKRIERMAKKMLPQVRKAELEKKRGSSSND